MVFGCAVCGLLLAQDGDLAKKQEAIERRLDVPAWADRLARIANAPRDQIARNVKALLDSELLALSDELAKQTDARRVRQTIVDYLRSHKFLAQNGVNVPDAFVFRASEETGENEEAHIGFVLLFDPGDAHEHASQAAVSLAAAVALRDYFVRTRSGTAMTIYGVPGTGERAAAAMKAMYEAKAFREMDLLVASRGATATSRRAAGFPLDRQRKPGETIALATVEEVGFTYMHRFGAGNEAAVAAPPEMDPELGWISCKIQTLLLNANTAGAAAHRGITAQAQAAASLLFDFSLYPDYRDAVAQEFVGLRDLWEQQARH